MRGFVAVALAVLALTACGQSQLQTTNARVPVPAGKPASFDDVEIDQVTQTVYAADRANSGVDVFDVSGAQPKFVLTIKLPTAPNGLAIDQGKGRIYAGTAGGAIEVIDAAKRAVVSEIKTSAPEIDLLDFAPGQNWLLAGTGAGGTVLTIDTTSDKILSTGKVGKPIEQPRFDAASGHVYATIPDLDALAVIDPKTGALVNTLKLGGCIPVGMAIRATTRTAVIACRKSVMAYDLRSGKKIDLGHRAAGGDLVHYFAGVDRFFVEAGHSTVPSVVGMFGGDPVADVSSVNVDGDGNAAVYDERSDTVYTTDPRPGNEGLRGFRMDGTKPVPFLQSALITVGPFVLLILIVVPLWWFLGRQADPIHRKRPEPRPAP